MPTAVTAKPTASIDHPTSASSAIRKIAPAAAKARPAITTPIVRLLPDDIFARLSKSLRSLPAAAWFAGEWGLRRLEAAARGSLDALFGQCRKQNDVVCSPPAVRNWCGIRRAKKGVGSLFTKKNPDSFSLYGFGSVQP